MIDHKNPGSSLTAADVNELAHSAARVAHMSGGGGVKVSTSQAGLSLRMATPGRGLTEAAIQARAVNVSDTDFKAFQPVTLAGHFFSGPDAQAKRIFKIDAPISGDEGWFALCAEPIKAGAAGRIYISGCCLARLVNPDECDFADISVNCDYLVGQTAGGAQIIWEDASTGDDVHLGLVRFSSPNMENPSQHYIRVGARELIEGAPLLPVFASSAYDAATGFPKLQSPVDLTGFDGSPYFWIHTGYQRNASGTIISGSAYYPSQYFIGIVDTSRNSGGSIVAGEPCGVLCTPGAPYFVRGVYGARVICRYPVEEIAGGVRCLLVRDHAAPLIEATTDPDSGTQNVQTIPYNQGTNPPSGLDFKVHAAS